MLWTLTSNRLLPLLRMPAAPTTPGVAGSATPLTGPWAWTSVAPTDRRRRMGLASGSRGWDGPRPWLYLATLYLGSRSDLTGKARSTLTAVALSLTLLFRWGALAAA